MPSPNSWRIWGDAFDRTSKYRPAVFADYLKWRWNIYKFTKKRNSGSLIGSYHKYFNQLPQSMYEIFKAYFTDWSEQTCNTYSINRFHFFFCLSLKKGKCSRYIIVYYRQVNFGSVFLQGRVLLDASIRTCQLWLTRSHVTHRVHWSQCGFLDHGPNGPLWQHNGCPGCPFKQVYENTHEPTHAKLGPC